MKSHFDDIMKPKKSSAPKASAPKASPLNEHRIDPNSFERDLDMISHPSKWPRRPLPMYHRWETHRGMRLVGIILENNPTTIYLGDVFDNSFNPTKDKTLKYNSIAELLEDGWTVD